MGPTEQQILIDYMNSGKGVYLEGTNIGFDHTGTDFWDMFGATYMGQGQEHGDVETVSGFEQNFANSMLFTYQDYTYADIYINRLGTNGGEEILVSEEMYTRSVAYSDSVYNAISSTVLFGALGDGEGLSRKVDLMRLYLAFLLNQEAPDIWVSEEVIDFDYVLLGNQAERQLIIQNSGLELLEVDSVYLSNDFFTMESDPLADLEFGDNLTFNITFDATEIGIFASDLVFVTNDPDTPELTIPIVVNSFEPQMIITDPDEIEVNAGEDDVIETTLSINNLGGGELDYQIVVYPQEEENSRAAGGPDEFGYHWRDSFHPEGPVYEWLDISEFGYNLGIIEVNSHADIILPFPFHFYGNIYQNVAVSSNGYLTFGGAADDQSNDQIPFVIDPDNLIAPLWDYLAPGAGSVTSYYDETVNRLIIQYTDWVFYISGGLSELTFQVQLFPNGDIMFIYQTLEGDLTSCTIGIENESASDGLQIAYNEEYLQGSMAIELFFQPEWLQLDQYLGTVLNGEPDELLLTLDSTGLPAGTYQAVIQIHSNDTHNPVVNIPVTFNVDYVDAGDDAIVTKTELLGNYPNPFNPTTTISFNITAKDAKDAKLEVYNIKGQKVKDLSPSLFHPSGAGRGPELVEVRGESRYSLIWNGRDENDQPVPSGVYFYKLQAGDYSSTRKMILLK